MSKVRIGVICPSEIAFRRFMPAVLKSENAEYIGVAHANAREWFGDSEPDETLILSEKEKAENFRKEYGGKVFDSYESLLTSPEVDAIYLPLPPALHYRWAKEALNHGKHIFLEKPSTTCLADTEDLINTAKEKRLAVHENYMFAFHKQFKEIRDIIASGKLGEVRALQNSIRFPAEGEERLPL